MISIPIAKPMLGDEEIEVVSKVMKSGSFASGPMVKEFEEKFASWCGTEFAIATSNGTTALHTSLACSGISPGDEVIVPSFSFIASATSISMCGARPVFADVDEDTFTISIDEIQNKISNKTKAIIGVHLYGQPCESDAIMDICEDKNLLFIEDAAQSHGALFKGRKTGSLGNAGCFSFYPTKNMTTGEGGMITTDDADLEKKARAFINHGQEQKYLHTSLGYNYRMTDINAAIGIVQLSKIEKFNRDRQENASFYCSNLNKKGLVLPVCKNDRNHVYHQFVIRIQPDFPLTRESFIEYLANMGIGTAIHYPIPIHHQPVYLQKYGEISCPVSEKLAKEVLSLPVHPLVSIKEREFIKEVVLKVE
jgi:perosamine synthetase